MNALVKPAMPPSTPLVLDLDGTVLRTDLFLESLVVAIKAQPWVLVLCIGWLLQGRAVLKRRIAERVALRADLLPLHDELVAFAAAHHAAGGVVHIATAADAVLARQVADRLGFVDQVLASDGRLNLKGAAKAEALAARFPDGFVYAGDCMADIPVWRVADGAVFAGRGARAEAAAGQATTLIATLPQARAGLSCWLRAARVHQWAKNLLIFMPLLLSGQGVDAAAWARAAAAFIGMGLLTSSTYLVNDALDLQDDRAHWRKKSRALASGELPLAQAMTAAPLGVLAGLGLAAVAGGWAALACLLAYLVVTLAYSLRLKRVPMLDVMIIASLFTLRLVLGAVVVGAPLKPWLFVFSMFLFTALALAKRAAEILRLTTGPDGQVGGRGYLGADAPVVVGFGVASSCAAVLVLGLYIMEDALMQGFYRNPQFLWGAPLTLTLWLGRIWLLCGRGQMDEDPVAFAVRDRVSLVLAGLTLVSAMAAVVL